MAEEKKKKGVTREERIKRSFPKGSKFVDKILKKDAEVGRDSKAIVAFPPQRGPGLPKQGVTTAPPKIKKETKPSRPKETKLAGTKAVAASTLTEAQRQALSNKQAAKKKKETKKDPLAGKPRSIAAAKKAGQLYFFDKNGVKKLAVTKADLDRTGLSLREYANKFAPKKVTKKEAEKFKKKAGGGMMKKKGAKAGGAMKKKGMAMGGAMMKKKMMSKGGHVFVSAGDGSPPKKMLRSEYERMLKLNKMFNIKVPKPVSAKKAGGVMKKKGAAGGGKMRKKMTAKAGGAMKKKMTARGGGAMKKKMYAGGGKMNKKMARAGGKMKKGYAVGGAMKKKGMKKGGKTMKMRGGGLATRGTNFRIR